jgi:iron complex transport system substrate-binding protein
MARPAPRLLRALLPGLLAGALSFGQAWATQYPLTVTDEAGRQVTIPAKPERVALQDGRDITLLALLDREDPFRRLVIWNDIPSRDDPAMWAALRQAWPDAAAIPDMGFGDDGQMDAERLLAARPQLVVAQRRALDTMTQAGVVQRLQDLHIPLLVVDSFNDPVGGVERSVGLLGQALDRESEAKDYTDYYTAHLNRLTTAIDGVPAAQRPSVFVEVLAGRQGISQCCFTHGDVGWGKLVAAVGARNIGSELLGGHPAGDVTLETAIEQRPDVYIMTGTARSTPGTALVPFGYGGDPAAVDAALARLEGRPGFARIGAVQAGRVVGLWHSFYNHNYNIVGLEYLAKAAYPALFPDLDPMATWHEILARFTRLPDSPVLLAAPARRPRPRRSDRNRAAGRRGAGRQPRRLSTAGSVAGAAGHRAGAGRPGLRGRRSRHRVRRARLGRGGRGAAASLRPPTRRSRPSCGTSACRSPSPPCWRGSAWRCRGR